MKKAIFVSFVVIICIAFVMSISISGCKNTVTETTEATTAPAETTEATTVAKTYKIAHLAYSSSVPASVLISSGIERVVKEMGNIELVMADINEDPAKVPEKVDYLLTQNIQGLIDATWDATAGAATVQKFKAANIPLVTTDVEFDKEYSFTIGADNYNAGETLGGGIAKFIKEKWNGEYDVIMCNYPIAGGESQKARLQGAIDVIVEQGIDVPENKISWFDTKDPMNVKKNIDDFLTAHPDSKKIVIIINTDDMYSTATSSIESMNRQNDVALFLYGAYEDVIINLKTKNYYIGDISFDLDKYGDTAVPLLIKLIDNPEAAKDMQKRQNSPVSYVDITNVDEFLK